MKLVHTSDWHLGRAFGPVSLHQDQVNFCDWFVNLVSNEQADLVVIAGDIYDRAIAPVESIELFRNTLRRLLETGAKIAAISGNHDGADRVSPYQDLLDDSGVVIRGGYEKTGEVKTLLFKDGPIDLVMLPFLDPQGAPDGFGMGVQEKAVETETLLDQRNRRTHESVLADAIEMARTEMRSPRSLATAHAFIQGGIATEDSERRLVVGGTGEVGAHLFDVFSYSALGHLHRPQKMDEMGKVRYSGTPLPYSFAEDHKKVVLIVDMDERGECEVRSMEIPVGRKVTTITGTIDELLDVERHPEAQDRFVRAIVTDRETVLDAKRRLENVYPHVIEIRLQPLEVAQSSAGALNDLNNIQPIEATRQFWSNAEGSEPDETIDSMLVRAVDSAAREAQA